MSQYRPQLEEALRIFGRASEAMKARGFSAPVLVGGAAVEIYSNSAVNTGDFDIVTPRQQEFEAERQRLASSGHPDRGSRPGVESIRRCNLALKWCREH